MVGVMGGERAGAMAGQQVMTVRQVMALAEQQRDAGQLAEAENLCRQILQAFPRHAACVGSDPIFPL